jgi:hypothetical protein
MSTEKQLSNSEVKGLRTAKELEVHLAALSAITPAALGILAVASGIYTYIGVSSLLEDVGAISFLAAVAYSIAVSVGIFVFWSYLMRLLPSMRNASGYIGLTLATIVGSCAIVAMSSWLNAAALAGSAAVEQHLALTVEEYQDALEQAYEIANNNVNLSDQVENARRNFEDLSASEASGKISGASGKGTVFNVLEQKKNELKNIKEQIDVLSDEIKPAFEKGSKILSDMRALTVDSGSIDSRSILFAENSVKLAGVITELRQLSIAPLVKRIAINLRTTIYIPGYDGKNETTRNNQKTAIVAVLEVLEQQSKTLEGAAQKVIDFDQPKETAYTAISKADAIIKYASNFAPSWAGAIAIDLLPAVLVFILAITQATIRRGRDGLSIEDTMTLSDLRAAMNAMKDVEASMGLADSAILQRVEGRSSSSKVKETTSQTKKT